MSKLLKIKEVCEELNISRRMFEQLIKERKIPFYPIGNQKRFLVNEVLEAIRNDNK